MASNRRHSVDSVGHTNPAVFRQIMSSTILALFFLRYLYVAESASQGDTLWIVALWFVAFVLWLLAERPTRSTLQSINFLDACVIMLSGGHIVSALLIVAGTSGDQRTAINLAWEWAGIIIAWFLLRQECRWNAFRRELLIGLFAIGISVASLGLYQHYFDFPEMAAKYGPRFERLRQADPVERAAIARELSRDQIPTEGPGLTLFEKRLRDSREPLGFFALANTFGGFLAVSLIFTATILAWALQRQQGSRYTLLIWIIAIALLGWCLLLTKSRTAWAGTAVSGISLIFAFGRFKLDRPRILAGVVGLATLAALIGILIRFGGLDRQVLTEAPKSLQYRLQYWTATVPMIRDHWLFGVGPGQFRWNYLIYKLPEASEEIADPHNLFLDVAANGGITALIGLVGLLLLVAFRPQAGAFSRTTQASDQTELPQPPIEPVLQRVPKFLAGFAAVIWCILLSFAYDDRLLVLLPFAIALTWALRKFFRPLFEDDRMLQIGAASALVALVVHLLGAGGIGMPAISLLFLILANLAVGPVSNSPMVAQSARSWRDWPLPAISLILPISLYYTALSPVAVVKTKLESGDQLVAKGKMDAADIQYTAAVVADPRNAEPWRRRAELAYSKVVAERFRSNESFLNAVGLLREARSRDPGGHQDDKRLGEMWFAKWRITGQTSDAAEAEVEFQKARDKYPTNVLLMADLAFALEATGQSSKASELADKAIQQEAINREWNHVDRFLPDSSRTHLERLSKEKAKESRSN